MITLSLIAICQCFKEVQVRTISHVEHRRAEQKLPPCSSAPLDGDNMSSEMLVDCCETESHHIPENGELHTHHSQNLKPQFQLYSEALYFEVMVKSIKGRLLGLSSALQPVGG
jgi:hypothetical protein